MSVRPAQADRLGGVSLGVGLAAAEPDEGEAVAFLVLGER
jgi:hypothetical protein